MGTDTITKGAPRPLSFIARVAWLAVLYAAVGFCARVLEFLLGGGRPGLASAAGRSLLEAARFGFAYVAAPMVGVICLDLIVQWAGPGEGMDYSYYPRAGRLLALCRSARARMVLWLGLLLLSAYWIATSVRYTLPDPPRILCTVMLLWGILWLADALTRPGRTTFGAALAYTLVCIGFAWLPALLALWGCAVVTAVLWLLWSSARALRRRGRRGRR